MKKTELDIIGEAVELFAEATKSTIGYSNEPGENEVWTHKAHGNRHLVMKGTKVGGMLGHVDRIPNVNMDDMSSDASKDGHHAYGVKYRKGKGGIIKAVDTRLGEFPSHEDAVAAVKKFHKINESAVLEEDYKRRLSKLGFKEQIPAETSDGLSGVYRFDHPDYEIEARPKVDANKDYKFKIKDKRTGRRYGSDHFSKVEMLLSNKEGK